MALLSSTAPPPPHAAIDGGGCYGFVHVTNTYAGSAPRSASLAGTPAAAAAAAATSASPARGRQVLSRRRSKQHTSSPPFSSDAGAASAAAAAAAAAEAAAEKAAAAVVVATLKAQKRALQKRCLSLKAANEAAQTELGSLLLQREEERCDAVGHVSIDLHVAVQARADDLQERLRAAESAAAQEKEARTTQVEAAAAAAAALERTLADRDAAQREAAAEFAEAAAQLTTAASAAAAARPLSSVEATQTPPEPSPHAWMAQALEDTEEASRRAAEAAMSAALAMARSAEADARRRLSAAAVAAEEARQGEVAGVSGCNELLRRQVAGLVERVRVLEGEREEAGQRWAELTAARAELTDKEVLCRELEAQVGELTTKLARSQQKAAACAKLRTELRASEGERTRVQSANELLKEKLGVCAELQEHLKKELDVVGESDRKGAALVATLEAEAEELRRVSETKAKDLALVRNLKAQQLLVADETSARFESLHDGLDGLVAILSAERLKMVTRFETEARDVQQTEVLQLLYSQQQQLALFQEGFDRLAGGGGGGTVGGGGGGGGSCVGGQGLNLGTSMSADGRTPNLSALLSPELTARYRTPLAALPDAPLDLDPGRSASAPTSPHGGDHGAVPPPPPLPSPLLDVNGAPTQGSAMSRPLELTEKSLAVLAQETAEKEGLRKLKDSALSLRAEAAAAAAARARTEREAETLSCCRRLQRVGAGCRARRALLLLRSAAATVQEEDDGEVTETEPVVGVAASSDEHFSVASDDEEDDEYDDEDDGGGAGGEEMVEGACTGDGDGDGNSHSNGVDDEDEEEDGMGEGEGGQQEQEEEQKASLPLPTAALTGHAAAHVEGVNKLAYAATLPSGVAAA